MIREFRILCTWFYVALSCSVCCSVPYAFCFPLLPSILVHSLTVLFPHSLIPAYPTKISEYYNSMISPPHSHIGSLSLPDNHRSKLLNRLGIYDAPSSVKSGQPIMTAAQVRRLRILRGMGVGYTLQSSPPAGSAVRPPLDNVQRFQERLKMDCCDKNTKNKNITTTSPAMTDKSSRRIAFQEDVEVVPIPTRYEYSDRIKSRIWSNRHELQENAERNALEFAADGWNWRTVTEDDGMFICSFSGELIHPVHLEHLMQEEREQLQHRLQRGMPVHSSCQSLCAISESSEGVIHTH
jgi:hypothetical protein